MKNQKTVVVTGATGTVGKALCKQLLEKDYMLIVCSRTPDQAREIVPGAVKYIAWSPTENGTPVEAIDGASAVVHLASAPAFGPRWTPAYKRTIHESCVLGTRGVVNAIIAAEQRPQTLISASSIGYYGYSNLGANAVTELDENAPTGQDFIAHLNADWEREAARAEEMGVLTVLLRSGFILASNGGGLPYLMNMTRQFRGGPTLPGTQFQTWIHVDDVVEIILLALEDERVRGPVNVVAPQPTTNAELMAALRFVMKRTFGMPMPGRLLQVFMGEAADILTRGRPVIPRKLRQLGYQYKFPTIESALQDLVDKRVGASVYTNERKPQ